MQHRPTIHIGRATVQTVRVSRRRRDIVVTGSGVPSIRNVPTSEFLAVHADVVDRVRAEARRPGGTSNWVRGFKGRPVLGNTAAIAGRSRKGAPTSVNLGSF